MADASQASLLLLSAIVFLPALAAIVVALLPSDKPDGVRYFTLATTIAVFLLTLLGLLDPLGWNSPAKFDAAQAQMQGVFNVAWIPSFDIEYFMGMDGISFPLVMLTAFLSVLAMGASWSITKYVKGYCILFLLLETGMLGVFLAADFFLFYVFWEVMLLPMYFLIGVWGGPRKEYAAIKFFLYTLVGSVFMLIAILMLYFTSDVRVLAEEYVAGGAAHKSRPIRWSELHIGASSEAKAGLAHTAPKAAEGAERADAAQAGLALLRRDAEGGRALEVAFVAGSGLKAEFDAKAYKYTVTVGPKTTAAEAAAVITAAAAITPAQGKQPVLAATVPWGSDGSGVVLPADSLTLAPYYPVPEDSTKSRKVHSFNLLALAAMGQHTTLFNGELLFGQSLQWWAFLLLFLGFIIKVPSVPVHTWLPDAHVEAPTPISMILAGILLKMGGYGIIRICYPICPHGGFDLAPLVCFLGALSMVYGALAALAQKDFKRMVAYSSVSHMGYVLLGLGVWSANSGNFYNPDYWLMGVKGAMFQMIGHGVSSAGMFFMVGIIYDRVHHRNLEEFGGLFGRMPVYTAMAMGLFFAALGLPGLCGFPGEVWVVLSVWKYSILLAVVSASVVVLTAGYILWALQRVYLGAEYKGPHGEHIHPTDARENLIGMVLLGFAIWFGVFPNVVLKYMDSTLDRQVNDLAAWTREVKEAPQPAAEVSQVGRAEADVIAASALTAVRAAPGDR